MNQNSNNLLIAVIVAAVLLVGGFFAASRFGLLSNTSVAGASFNQDAYHAVFLSNNQVYFGKVESAGGQYVKLTDIYYLILKRPLQQQTPEGAEGENQQAKPEYTVVKLGNELHGPKDEMSINRDQILFVEELKNDSKVVQAIEQFKQKKAEGTEGEPVTQ